MELKFVPPEAVVFDKNRKLSNKAYLLALSFLVFCICLISVSGYFGMVLVTPFAAIAMTVIFLFSKSAIKIALPILFAAGATAASVFVFGGNPVTHISALAFIPLALMAFVALKNNFKQIEFICFVSAVSVLWICLGGYLYYAVLTGIYNPSDLAEWFKITFDNFAQQVVVMFQHALLQYWDALEASPYASTLDLENLLKSLDQIYDMICTCLLFTPALIVVLSNVIAFVMASGIKFLSRQYKPLEMVPSLWPFTVSAFSGVLYLVSNLVYIISLVSSNGEISDSLIGVIAFNIYSVLSVSFLAFGLSLIPKIWIAMRKNGKMPISPMMIILLLIFLFLSPASFVSIVVSLITFFGVALSIWGAVLRFKHNLNNRDM